MNNRVSFDRVEVDGVTVEVSTIELLRMTPDGVVKTGTFETMFFIDSDPGHRMHQWRERHSSKSDAVHGHDAIVLDLEFGVWPS